MDRDQLKKLVEAGASQRDMAATLGVSQATVRYWLRRHDLKSMHRPYPRDADGSPHLERDCSLHGRTTFVRRSDGGYRCTECRRSAVSARRREMKRILVEEAGGACEICGYDKCLRALHFHHRDPAQKLFALSGRGFSRSLAALRTEAEKCALLCGNCHCELEEGLTTLP